MVPFSSHQILNSDDSYFPEFWGVYTSSFPLTERRTIDQQTAVFNNPDYFLSVILIDNQLIGFISYWVSKEFVFIEHLAIRPESRNKGLGKVILKPFIESLSVPVILEIELPVDALTEQRLRFYESLNFKINNHKHAQPPYHNGDEPIPMKILSYPAEISDLQYQMFATFQKDTVLGSNS